MVAPHPLVQAVSMLLAVDMSVYPAVSTHFSSLVMVRFQFSFSVPATGHAGVPAVGAGEHEAALQRDVFAVALGVWVLVLSLLLRDQSRCPHVTYVRVASHHMLYLFLTTVEALLMLVFESFERQPLPLLCFSTVSC